MNKLQKNSYFVQPGCSPKSKVNILVLGFEVVVISIPQNFCSFFYLFRHILWSRLSLVVRPKQAEAVARQRLAVGMASSKCIFCTHKQFALNIHLQQKKSIIHINTVGKNWVQNVNNNSFLENVIQSTKMSHFELNLKLCALWPYYCVLNNKQV